MVSTLASQLQQLREAGAGSKQKTDTFLYDPREAARVDNETIYNLAWNGLLELKQMDARFEEFDANKDIARLFSRQRIHFHRAQLAKHEDAELNAALAKVLDALSGYFLLGATHKVLEFLVRRYEVHRFNVHDVMATIVSYHESPWFAKMVRILHIHNTRWEFLLQVKQSGEPLLRAALVQRALDDSSIADFLFATATRIGAANPKLISLYTLVTLEMLEHGQVREATLRTLIPQLLTSLKSAAFPELQSSAFMIITKLSSKAILTAKVIETLAKHLVKYAQPGTHMNALLCVIFLAQTQPSFELSKSVGKHVLALESLIDLLSDAEQSYDTTKFVRALALFLVDSLAAADDSYDRVLAAMIPAIAFSDELVQDVVRALLEHAKTESYDYESPRVQAIGQTLVALSKQYVGKVDAVVHAVVASPDDARTKKETKAANKFLALTFRNVANSAHFVASTTDATTSLALALDHPTEHMRYQALVALAKQCSAAAKASDDAEQAPLALTNGSVLLRRMLDDSVRIARFVFTSSLSDLVVRTVSKRKCLETLVQVVRKWSRTLPSSPVLDAALAFASDKFRCGYSVSASDDEQLLVLLLAFVPIEFASAKAATASVDIDVLATYITQLEHPFGAALAASRSPKKAKSKMTVERLVDVFGATLASHVQTLLPFVLSWSQPTAALDAPLTPLVVSVLKAARSVLVASKKHKDLAALDQSFRFVLKREFVALCEAPTLSDKTTQWAVAVASTLSDIVDHATFAASRDDFDASVATLLQAPSTLFVHVQTPLLALFAGAMERELLPTMARLATMNSGASDVMAPLVKSRALDLISAVLEGFQYTESAAELQRVVHVVPSVLVALSDANKSVRQSALACLDRWLATSSDRVLASRTTALHTLHAVSTYLVAAKQDMLMDANAVGVLCATYSTASPTDSAAFYQLLMDFISSATADERAIAVKLLALLSHVTDAAFWLQSVDYFAQTLAGLVSGADATSESASAATMAVLTMFLTKYLDVSVAVKTTKTVASVHKPFVDALVAVLQVDKAALARVQPLQIAALTTLSPAFYRALDDVSRFVLVSTLLQVLVVADEAVATTLINCLSTLPIQYAVFGKLLDSELAAVGKPTTVAKTRGAAVKSDALFQHLSCILEVLSVKVDSAIATETDAHVDESAASANALLKTLGDVLALFCAKEHEAIVSEYILQVLFGCLRRVCEVRSAVADKAVTVAKKSAGASAEVEPELLVKHTLACLSRTTSPQTRNDALLFVSALVHLFPASVLASLEKILSFVGAGTIHQDDEYSFHVLETIVHAVVPHIVRSKSSTTRASDVHITPQQFIRIFVDAYEQIPRSRRELLFHALLTSLGSASLPYCVSALVQRTVGPNVSSDTRSELTAFAHSLCFAFGANVQIASLVSVLAIARDLLPHVMDESETDNDDGDEDDDDEEGESATGAYGPFVFDRALVQQKRQAQELNAALVAFVPAHLQARELHHEILRLQASDVRAAKRAGDDSDEDDDDEEESESEADKLQHSYLMLAQVVLLYFRRVAREESLEHDDARASAFWTALSSAIIDVLSALQKLLSTPGFVAVISELLHHENSLVRKKAMQLFNDRLTDERSALSSGEELLFVDMLDELDAILANADGHENTVNVQTALLSVDILARSFASKHAKRFQQSLPTIVTKYIAAVDPTKASPTVLHLFGCAFVCVSSICRAVGPLVFPLLPKFFPKLLAGIDWCARKLKPAKREDRSAASGMATVLQCLLASLEVFTDKIAQFLAPYLSTIVQTLVAPSLLAASASNAQLQVSLDASLLHLTSRVELRHLLPSVFGSYDAALALASDASVEKLFAIVSTIVASLDVSALRQHLPSFARFFVTALDARRVHASKLQDVDAVEDDVLECLVQFVLKLSEKQLKPLFLKVHEWSRAKVPTSSSRHGDVARRIVFVKLVVKLSERLRGIFVPYFAHVLEALTTDLQDARSVLTQKQRKAAAGDASDSESDSDDDFFTRDDSAAPAAKKSKLANGHASSAETPEAVRESYALLLRTTVRALNGCFVHDSDGFMEKDRFELVMAPLVDVVDVLKHDASAATKAFVLEVVAPCLANLAWAAKSDLLWKPLHYAVLMKSRCDTPSVRLATLKTVEQCYQVIGDEFLAMLPESIPFLAELMEDTDSEVERTCHHVIKQIEEISGESLDQYLTS